MKKNSASKHILLFNLHCRGNKEALDLKYVIYLARIPFEIARFQLLALLYSFLNLEKESQSQI